LHLGVVNSIVTLFEDALGEMIQLNLKDGEWLTEDQLS
jgi:hypothetical protein